MCGTKILVRRSFARGPLLLGFAISAIVGLACTKAPVSLHGADAASEADAAVTIIIPTEIPTEKRDSSPTLCGNGLQDGDEACDDGNTLSGDGCSSRCLVELGWLCPRFGQPCMGIYACGNGLLSAGEACDDGNTVSGDGCSGDCQQVEPGWRCGVPGRPCTEVCGMDAGACADGGSAAVCGNGIVEPGEECDDGSDPSRTPHNDDNAYGGCTTQCTYGAYCGDGAINGQEACDDGPAYVDLYHRYGKPGCTYRCTTPSYCGDGILDVLYAEECDLGAENGRCCTQSCKIVLSCLGP